jgi:hypothetical protein
MLVFQGFVCAFDAVAQLWVESGRAAFPKVDAAHRFARTNVNSVHCDEGVQASSHCCDETQ